MDTKNKLFLITYTFEDKRTVMHFHTVSVIIRATTQEEALEGFNQNFGFYDDLNDVKVYEITKTINQETGKETIEAGPYKYNNRIFTIGLFQYLYRDTIDGEWVQKRFVNPMSISTRMVLKSKAALYYVGFSNNDLLKRFFYSSRICDELCFDNDFVNKVCYNEKDEDGVYYDFTNLKSMHDSLNKDDKIDTWTIILLNKNIPISHVLKCYNEFKGMKGVDIFFVGDENTIYRIENSKHQQFVVSDITPVYSKIEKEE